MLFEWKSQSTSLLVFCSRPIPIIFYSGFNFSIYSHFKNFRNHIILKIARLCCFEVTVIFFIALCASLVIPFFRKVPLLVMSLHRAVTHRFVLVILDFCSAVLLVSLASCTRPAGIPSFCQVRHFMLLYN